jgi:hypothetical protein
MDVTKAPPIDPGAGRMGTAPASTSQSGAALPETVAVLLDRVDIQPLDSMGALLILIAELRTELASPAETSMAADPAAAMATVTATATAPQTLVQMFLQALPEETQEPAAWMAAVTRVETALVTALNRGVDAIAGWRNVPPAVVEDAQETRTIVVAALTDDPPNPLWLRPEWLGLAPGIQRFWRRRRWVRRGLSDPDLDAHGRDQERHQQVDEKPPIER